MLVQAFLERYLVYTGLVFELKDPQVEDDRTYTHGKELYLPIRLLLPTHVL